MEMALHDGNVQESLYMFERIYYVAMAHDETVPEGSSLEMIDARLTPLGEYVSYCNRTTSKDEPHVTVPKLSVVHGKGFLLLYGYQKIKRLILETMFGPPMLTCILMMLFYVYRFNYYCMVLSWIFSFLFLLLTLMTGFAYRAGWQYPEDRFAHLSNPMSRSTFFKVTPRIFKQSITDPGSEMCVNIIKEILNVENNHTIHRLVLNPMKFSFLKPLYKDSHTMLEDDNVIKVVAELFTS